jgi:heterodisulfide reductase subunit A-like polyferredoxin
MWKCRPVESLEIQRQDFHPSPRPWKSLRDSHIPTRATISLIICRGTQDQTSEKCYPCSRIEVLPMFPAGHYRARLAEPRPADNHPQFPSRI